MRPDRVTLAAFVGFVLIAGAVSVAIRLGSFELPPFWAATLRYAMAVTIFTALAIALHIPFPRGANLLGALLMSLTFVVSTALYYVGISGSSASMGAIAFALTPLVTLALAAVIGLERFTLRGVAGALALGTDATIETACGQCGAAIRLEIHAGAPQRREPERLWLAAGGDDLRADFCTPTVLLCSPAHADEWARGHDHQGELFDLEAGATLGGEHWATCAAAAKLLGGRTDANP